MLLIYNYIISIFRVEYSFNLKWLSKEAELSKLQITKKHN